MANLQTRLTKYCPEKKNNKILPEEKRERQNEKLDSQNVALIKRR
jgi:hypothetical protein